MKSGFDILLHYASWLVNCLYNFICTANLFKISTTVSYGSHHHAKHKIMIIKPILNFAASKPKLRHLARITHMVLSIGTFTATLHLRHVERSEVQDTGAAHAYVMADLLCHLLDLFYTSKAVVIDNHLPRQPLISSYVPDWPLPPRVYIQWESGDGAPSVCV